MWVGVVGGALLLSPSAASVTAKKAKPCTILKPAAIEAIVGAPVSAAGEAGTLQLGCDFDVGAGIGEPGGGFVVIQYYEGTLAKSVWAAAKSGEKVGKLYWDPVTEIASGFKKGKMIAASVTYTPPDPADLREQSLALAKLALSKL